MHKVQGFKFLIFKLNKYFKKKTLNPVQRWDFSVVHENFRKQNPFMGDSFCKPSWSGWSSLHAESSRLLLGIFFLQIRWCAVIMIHIFIDISCLSLKDGPSWSSSRQCVRVAVCITCGHEWLAGTEDSKVTTKSSYENICFHLVYFQTVVKKIQFIQLICGTVNVI